MFFARSEKVRGGVRGHESRCLVSRPTTTDTRSRLQVEPGQTKCVEYRGSAPRTAMRHDHNITLVSGGTLGAPGRGASLAGSTNNNSLALGAVLRTCGVPDSPEKVFWFSLCGACPEKVLGVSVRSFA